MLGVRLNQLVAGVLLAVASGQPEAAAGGNLVRGPYLQSLLATSVDIVWATDGGGPGRVRFRAR